MEKKFNKLHGSSVEQQKDFEKNARVFSEYGQRSNKLNNEINKLTNATSKDLKIKKSYAKALNQVVQSMLTLDSSSKGYYSTISTNYNILQKTYNLNKNFAQSYIDSITPIKAYRDEISKLKDEMKEAFNITNTKTMNTPVMQTSASTMMSDAIGKENNLSSSQTEVLKSYIVEADKVAIETEKLYRNQQTLAEYLARTSNLTRKQADSFVPLISEMKQVGAEGKVSQDVFDGYVEKLMRIGNVSKETATNLTKMFMTSESGANVTNSLKEMTNLVVQLHVATRAVTSVFRILGNVIREATQGYMEFETLEVSLGIVTGSAAEASKQFEELKQMAAVTPFNVQQLVEGASQLEQIGVRAEKIKDTLTMIGDISGGNQYKFKHILNNYIQILAKGKAMEIDIREFANMGVPIRKMLMDMGVQGNATAKQITEAFKKMTEEGGVFYNGMEIHSQTMNGLISTLADTWKELTATWIENTGGATLIKDILHGIITVTQGVINTVNENKIAFGLLNVTMTAIAGYILGTIIPSFAKYTGELLKNTLATMANLSLGKQKVQQEIKSTVTKGGETIAVQLHTKALNAENKALGVNVGLKALLNPSMLAIGLATASASVALYNFIKGLNDSKNVVVELNNELIDERDILELLNDEADKYVKKLKEIKGEPTDEKILKKQKAGPQSFANLEGALQWNYDFQKQAFMDFKNLPINVMDLANYKPEMYDYSKFDKDVFNTLNNYIQQAKLLQEQKYLLKDKYTLQSEILKQAELETSIYQDNVAALNDAYSKTDEGKMEALKVELEKYENMLRQNKEGGVWATRKATEYEMKTGQAFGKDAKFIEDGIIRFRAKYDENKLEAVIKKIKEDINKGVGDDGLAGWQKILKKVLGFSDEDVEKGLLKSEKIATDEWRKRLEDTNKTAKKFAKRYGENESDIYISNVESIRKMIKDLVMSGEWVDSEIDKEGTATYELNESLKEQTKLANDNLIPEKLKENSLNLQIALMDKESQLAYDIYKANKNILTMENARKLAKSQINANVKEELELIKKNNKSLLEYQNLSPKEQAIQQYMESTGTTDYTLATKIIDEKAMNEIFTNLNDVSKLTTSLDNWFSLNPNGSFGVGEQTEQIEQAIAKVLTDYRETLMNRDNTKFMSDSENKLKEDFENLLDNENIKSLSDSNEDLKDEILILKEAIYDNDYAMLRLGENLNIFEGFVSNGATGALQAFSSNADARISKKLDDAIKEYEKGNITLSEVMKIYVTESTKKENLEDSIAGALPTVMGNITDQISSLFDTKTTSGIIGSEVTSMIKNITNNLGNSNGIWSAIANAVWNIFFRLVKNDIEEQKESDKLEEIKKQLEINNQFLKDQLDYLNEVGLKMQNDFLNRKLELGQLTNVNDMILTPQGRFSTAPDDYIIATKHPEQLGSIGGTMNVIINNTVSRDTEVTATTQNNNNGIQELMITISKKIANDVSSGNNGWDNALAARDFRLRGRSVN